MERTLKERIIGAAVLAVVMVLVVPIFLDGPPEGAETVSETVLLPGQSEQETRTVVLDRERSVPIPASSTPEDNEPTNTPPLEEKPEPEPAAAEPVEVAASTPEQQAPAEAPESQNEAPKPVTPAVSSTGMWAVQLGSFADKKNAENLAANLRKQGYAAFLSQLQTGSGALHRVRIGPQKDRASAEQMAARLAKANHKGQVVPHP